MLKAVVEHMHRAAVVALRHKAGLVAAGTDQNGDTGQATGHDLGFVAADLDRHAHAVTVADHGHLPAGRAARVATAQNRGVFAGLPERRGERDDQRRLAAAADREVADADDRALEPARQRRAFPVACAAAGRHPSVEGAEHTKTGHRCARRQCTTRNGITAPRLPSSGRRTSVTAVRVR